ncbi:MAG: bile acid:sodium symporter [Burkholderiaceae bacterium]|nr:bile acid:sodium symporter [Burkholderiaceae bacterium]
MKHLQEHLNRWLVAYVALAMAAGLALGHPNAIWIRGHQGAVSTLNTVAVFFIIYPMMINIKLGALHEASRNIKGLALTVVFNFLWAPLVGWLLARIFLTDPTLALGFLLVMVVPCSSMSIGYTGLSKGNLELATVAVALSFVLAVVAVPLWMTVFAAGYDVPVPVGDLLKSILTVLIAPMVLGHITRHLLNRRLGEQRFQKLQPLFPIVSMLAMYGIVFMIFLAKAPLIVDQWPTVLLLLVPNGLFIALTLVVATWVNRRFGLSYADNMAVVFASTGKNNGTAIAIATMAFSPMVAIPAATMPVFQILFLVLYLRMARWLQAYFDRSATALGMAH